MKDVDTLVDLNIKSLIEGGEACGHCGIRYQSVADFKARDPRYGNSDARYIDAVCWNAWQRRQVAAAEKQQKPRHLPIRQWPWSAWVVVGLMLVSILSSVMNITGMLRISAEGGSGNSATVTTVTTMAPGVYESNLRKLWLGYEAGIEGEYRTAVHAGDLWRAWAIAAQLKAACEAHDDWTKADPMRFPDNLTEIGGAQQYEVPMYDTIRSVADCMRRLEAEIAGAQKMEREAAELKKRAGA